jgi:hypothetical protein
MASLLVYNPEEWVGPAPKDILLEHCRVSKVRGPADSRCWDRLWENSFAGPVQGLYEHDTADACDVMHPVQLPRPCFNVFPASSAPRSQLCCTCILPHLGAQITPGERAFLHFMVPSRAADPNTNKPGL